MAAEVTRKVALVWVEKLFRDLTPAEKELTTAALGNLPWDEYCGSIEHLFERWERGEIGCYELKGEDGRETVAWSFFELVELVNGSLCFESLCTVSGGPTDRRLAETDMATMEALARSVRRGDQKVTSMAMRTPRHGLAKILVEKQDWYVSEITLRKVLNA